MSSTGDEKICRGTGHEIKERRVTLIQRQMKGQIDYFLEYQSETEDGKETPGLAWITCPDLFSACRALFETEQMMIREKKEKRLKEREHFLKIKRKELEQRKRKLEQDIEELELEKKEMKVSGVKVRFPAKATTLTPIPKPKPVRTAFGRFVKDVLPKLQGRTLTSCELTRELGKLWVKADPETRALYNMQELEDRKRFTKEWEKYKQDHSDHCFESDED